MTTTPQACHAEPVEVYTSADIRTMLEKLVHHRSAMISGGLTLHEMGQRKAITELTTKLPHIPRHDMHALLVFIHSMRHHIYMLNYSESSRYSHKSEQIRSLIGYAKRYVEQLRAAEAFEAGNTI